MRAPVFFRLSRILSLLLILSLLPAPAAPPVPAEKLQILQTVLVEHRKTSSAARKRLALKRMIRDAGELLEAYPEAPNRFEILGLVFQAQQALFSLDQSRRTREALLETSRALATAPDSYADLRLDADLLLSQTEMAREGADAEARVEALRPIIRRYRETPAEAKMLRVALVMALELGDSQLIRELRDEITKRFAGDLEMIIFQREKLGGQVFGAPFCGTFEGPDNVVVHFPSEALGRSTGLYFWSVKDGGLDDLKNLANTWHEKKEEVSGRLNIISINVDELPDAGKSILLNLDLPWTALHLPGGRKNSHYRAFARQTPALVTLSPTGYAALVMSGATRRSSGTTPATRDYTRWFGSTLARSWTLPRYVSHLNSILAGDFFITDPSAPFDPACPPELRAHFLQSEEPIQGLKRTNQSVPTETLEEIQKCFQTPPLRYRLPPGELKEHYLDAEKRCAAAIASHPDAPDLWIVYNRRIIAQLGLWKLTADFNHFKNALQQARTAMTLSPPSGGDLIARFVLAKESLRETKTKPENVINDFLESQKTDEHRGLALAAASLLALDLGKRDLHEKFRSRILKDHLDHPVMWTYGAFLLNPYHRYQLFRAPFVSGRSFGRRQDYALSLGTPEKATRHLELSFPTIDGGRFEQPPGQWTAILIHGEPVTDKRAPLYRDLRALLEYREKRPLRDLEIAVLLTSTELEATRSHLQETPPDCPVLTLPGGIQNPLAARLGILSEDECANLLILRPDGSIARFISGLSMKTKAREGILQNTLEWQDEQNIISLLENGENGKAQTLAFTLAPPGKKEVAGAKAPKNKKVEHSIPHLRSRARVRLALGDLPSALRDAGEVVKRQTAIDAAMSLRSEELDLAEDLRKTIQKRIREE